MTHVDLLRQRLHNQHVSSKPLKSAADVVASLCAMQAQDYAGVKWAIGQRSGLTDAQVERAFDSGAILRTHAMRPTWHALSPADIRWVLMLTGPRVSKMMGSYNRKLALDAKVFARSAAAIEKALRGGRHLTRAELADALRKARLIGAERGPAAVQKLAHIVMQAELDALICNGAKRGKQFTYALLEERVPKAKPLSRDAACVELARRFFTRHGPATIKDYSWWSGLTMGEARAGLEAVQSELTRDEIDGLAFWSPKSMTAAKRDPGTAHLIPAYDETLIAYRDARAPLDAGQVAQMYRDVGQTIAIDGRVAGTWRRTVNKDHVVLEAWPFGSLTRRETRAVEDAAERYARFIGMPLRLSFVAQD